MATFIKNIFNQIYRVRFVLLAGGMGIILFVFVAFAEKSAKKTECNGIHIRFFPAGTNKFLNESDVITILNNAAGGFVTGRKFSDLKFNELESALDHNNFIKNAEVYSRLNDTLYVEITYRNPILRIMSILHDDYYIDEYGDAMPLSPNHTAKILVATGYINGNNDTTTEKSLYKMAMIINRDPFLKSLVGQIQVNQESENEKEFILIPRIGNLNIVLGDTVSLADKFRKLKIFFAKVYPELEQDKYSSINLNFKDQIILKKNINE